MATTSYNGWPASRDSRAIGINSRWEPIPGHDFPGGIKGGDVEVVFTYLVQQLHARVERIDHYPDGDEWGYHYKPSANSPSLLSCHSSGTAIDYNATKHPNGRRGTWAAAQVAEVRKILAEIGVIRWLYDASGTPDEMHFEIRGTPAQVRAAADRLRTQPKEMFTMAQFDEIMREIGALRSEVGELRAGLLVSIAEGRELDEDIPENLAAQQSEVIRTVRAIAAKTGAVVQPPNPG